MLLALLSVYAVEDRRIWTRTFFAFLPMILATMLAEGEVTSPPVEFYGSWLLGFALALIGLIMFVDATRLAMKQRSFADVLPE